MLILILERKVVGMIGPYTEEEMRFFSGSGMRRSFYPTVAANSSFLGIYSSVLPLKTVAVSSEGSESLLKAVTNTDTKDDSISEKDKTARTKLINAILSDSKDKNEVVRKLLTENIVLSVVNNDELSIIAYAVKLGDNEIVKMIMEKINSTNKSGVSEHPKKKAYHLLSRNCGAIAAEILNKGDVVPKIRNDIVPKASMALMKLTWQYHRENEKTALSPAKHLIFVSGLPTLKWKKIKNMSIIINRI